jgi:nicotinamide-nucleotide amidase
MARGGCRALTADVCIADTGIAGPGGDTPEKPVGLFYFGLAHLGAAFSRKHEFHGDRGQNKREAAIAALAWLKEYLESLGGGRASVS